ncbi:MAG: hypothetical protein ABSB01_20000 [Streptosporangiaceae bacterium]|jgi:hypothetical protein
MMFIFLRGRYGPLLRVAGGVALVAFGIVYPARLAIILGGVLAVWGIAEGISRRPGRASNTARGSGQGSRDRFGAGR